MIIMLLFLNRVIFGIVIGIAVGLPNIPAISVIKTLLVMRVPLHVLLALSRGIVELVVLVIIRVVMIRVSMVMFSEIIIIKVKAILLQDTHWSKWLVIEAVLVVFLAARTSFTIIVKVYSRDSIFFRLRMLLFRLLFLFILKLFLFVTLFI